MPTNRARRGSPTAAAEPVDGDRRGVGGEDRAGRRDARRAPPTARVFTAEVLEHRLDDQVRVGGRAEVVGRRPAAPASRRGPPASSRPLATDRSRLPAIRSRPAIGPREVRLVERDLLADGRVDLGDAVAHQPGARHEHPLDAHRRASSPGRRRPAARRRPRTGPSRGRRPRRWPRRCRLAAPAPRAGPRAARPGPPGPAPSPARAAARRRPRRRPAARCRSRAASSAGTPSPVSAVVTRTSGRFGRGPVGAVHRRAARPVGTSIARSWAAVRWAPGRSPLLTTTMSATSSSPALIAWTSSPISGASRTTVVSAAAATSTSLWPVPTVSSRTTSNPAASSTRRRDRGRRREPAGVPARRHRADEHAVVVGVGLHPDAVAEERAAGDRRRRVDGHDRDRAPGLAHSRDQRGHERRLAGAGRPGDPDEVGAARPAGRGGAGRARRRACGSRPRSAGGPARAVAGEGGIGEGVGTRRRGLGHVAAGPATRAASRCRG